MQEMSGAVNLRSIFAVLVTTMFGSSALASIPGYPIQGHFFRASTYTVEHWGSGSESLVLYGDGTALAVADAMIPAAPVVLGKIDTGYVVWHIDITDDGMMAAVTDRDKWVTLIDISNRSAPSILGRYEVEDGRLPYGAAFGNGYLHVAIGPAGLWVLDISNPAAPSLAGNYIEPGTDFVFDVEVLGNHAFLADDSDGVTAIDISNPAAPTFAGRFAGATSASHISIEGTTAYVSRRNLGVSILDLSAAPAMTELGTFSDPTGGLIYRAEVVDGDRIICADGLSGLVVANIASPAAPVIESRFTQSTFAVATDGATAFSIRASFFANPTLFVLEVDTAAPFDPLNHVGSVSLVGDNIGVAIDGDTVLIGNETGGVFVIDASDPSDLQTVSQIDLGSGTPASLTMAGPTLAYGAFGHDLGLVDLTDPGNPVLLADFPIPGGGYASDVITVPGTLSVLVGSVSAGVTFVDLTDPTTPAVTGSWAPSTGAVLHADLEGDRIAAGGSNDVWVLDASNMATPVELGSFTVPGTVHGVVIRGDYVYVAANTSGVRIWDISNPASPFEAAVYSTSPTSANGLAVRGDRLYVAADTFWGLLIADVSDPSSPAHLEEIGTTGKALEVAVTDDIVALADFDGGVHIWGQISEVPLFADGFESGDTSAW